MQLTRFTDLGLRVLMYLSESKSDQLVTIAEISERFGIPHNHLSKIVQLMGQQGWLVNVRGKGGGMRLAQAANQYQLGHLVRVLERTDNLIDCTKPPCVLHGRCGLNDLLAQAQENFYEKLNQFTLADAMPTKTHNVLVKLHRGAVGR